MQNNNTEQQDSVMVDEESTDHNQNVISHTDVNHGEYSILSNEADGSTTSEEEQAPRLETYTRKHGFGWGSAEKINGCIDPKAHVDWVMMMYYGFSLEYLINFIDNLINNGCDRTEAVEAVMAEFGLDEMHADIVSESVFGEPFYAVIEDIHGWISDYEPDEDDEDNNLARCKREMHEYVVWAVMEELAFLKMNEVNPNPD